jgi:hypothetical protein
MNLEGKKAHLEGTWRAVVGRLEGKTESPQSLDKSHSKGKTILTWRVFGKSIYMDHYRKKDCHNHPSRKCSTGAGLQRSYTHTTLLSSLTAMPIICIQEV